VCVRVCVCRYADEVTQVALSDSFFFLLFYAMHVCFTRSANDSSYFVRHTCMYILIYIYINLYKKKNRP